MAGHALSVTRRARFSAARSLRSDALDAAANASLFGREARLHGHDFTLYVTVAGEAPADTGMVMDLKALSRLVRSQVVEPLDRSNLDQAELLRGQPATTENLSIAVWRRLASRLPAGSLREVRIEEGSGKSVRYQGG